MTFCSHMPPATNNFSFMTTDNNYKCTAIIYTVDLKQDNEPPVAITLIRGVTSFRFVWINSIKYPKTLVEVPCRQISIRSNLSE